ncbi:MAG: FAD-binding oxidoreductase [Kyrpidia sp.]|nr:FAD-binding oxidoreductase [Kyrpidia sp.]
MAVGWEKGLIDRLGPELVRFDLDSRNRLSKDYYWYSPVLKKRLSHKIADSIVIPNHEQDVVQVLSFAAEHRIPLTVRGAGTGNYGQAVPIRGGMVMDMSEMNRIMDIGDGYARVEAGVRLGTLEREARRREQELRIYPSTFEKATVGGFVCGGSGGIGSITWGSLWDGNVLEMTILTMEITPKKLVVSGRELLRYIHNYGTNGVVTELVIPLARRTEWAQAIVSFPVFEDSLRFADALSKQDAVKKRLVSVNEWPIPKYFIPLKNVILDGHAAVLLEVEEGSCAEVESLAERHRGKRTYFVPASNYRKGLGLSNFSWNHTTLWAIKTDPEMTYLQAGFDPNHFIEQTARIKSEYGDEVLLHYEWVRHAGTVMPQALPLVSFTTEERLYEIIEFCRRIGVRINDPHTWRLDAGGRGEQVISMWKTKLENDPFGLLNPGKFGQPNDGPDALPSV